MHNVIAASGFCMSWSWTHLTIYPLIASQGKHFKDKKKSPPPLTFFFSENTGTEENFTSHIISQIRVPQLKMDISVSQSKAKLFTLLLWIMKIAPRPYTIKSLPFSNIIEEGRNKQIVKFSDYKIVQPYILPLDYMDVMKFIHVSIYHLAYRTIRGYFQLKRSHQ